MARVVLASLLVAQAFACPLKNLLALFGLKQGPNQETQHDFHQMAEDHHQEHEHEHWHGRHKWMQKFHAARECHQHCGTNVTCHHECPKPWEKLNGFCQEMKDVKACVDQCGDQGSDCVDKCPNFQEPWLQRKVGRSSERLAIMETKCQKLAEVGACHKACAPGNFTCHANCHVTLGHWDGHILGMGDFERHHMPPFMHFEGPDLLAAEVVRKSRSRQGKQDHGHHEHGQQGHHEHSHDGPFHQLGHHEHGHDGSQHGPLNHHGHHEYGHDGHRHGPFNHHGHHEGHQGQPMPMFAGHFGQEEGRPVPMFDGHFGKEEGRPMFEGHGPMPPAMPLPGDLPRGFPMHEGHNGHAEPGHSKDPSMLKHVVDLLTGLGFEGEVQIVQV